MTRAQRLLLDAQLAFWICVGLCFAVTGGGLFSHNHGLSFYGGRWSTIVPWTVGLAAASFLVLRAAEELVHTDPPLVRALRLNVLLVLSILFTPDTVSQLWYVLHIVASTALFLFQAALGLWLVLRSLRAVVLQLYVVQIAGGIVAGLSQVHLIDLLGIGIVVFQVAFGALLVCFPIGDARVVAAREATGTD
jgi:hypothetical protein